MLASAFNERRHRRSCKLATWLTGFQLLTRKRIAIFVCATVAAVAITRSSDDCIVRKLQVRGLPKSLPRWSAHDVFWKPSRTAIELKNLFAVTRNANPRQGTVSSDSKQATVRPNSTQKFVSLCAGTLDGRRLGNQLFNFAAMLQVAHETKRVPIMSPRGRTNWLDRIFHVSINRVVNVDESLCPCAIVRDGRSLAYDSSLLNLPNNTDLANKTLLLCGWFQSWKYTNGIEYQLTEFLTFRSYVLYQLERYFEAQRPQRWPQFVNFKRVAIHVRAGDIMNNRKFSFGYTIPKTPFFQKAMHHVVEEFRKTTSVNETLRVQFFVLSDSINWVRSSLGLTSVAYGIVNRTRHEDIQVTYSEGNSAAVDMALMSRSDAVIMTTGTYGWWGAWLANKTTVYYQNWPRNDSPLAKKFSRSDFYPPSWLSFDGPYFTF